MNTFNAWRTSQRGAAGPKAIVAFLILAAVIYGGLQIGRLYYDHWNLEDDIKGEVNFAFVNIRDNIQEKLVASFTNKLTAIHADFKKEQIKVQVDEGKKKIVVEIWYSRKHKLPLYPNPQQFYIKYENKTLD